MKQLNLNVINLFAALTVQYLTNRFIGDYYSGTDMTYHHSFPYMGGSLKTNVDIIDISRPIGNDVG